jgi:hypothetical protein
MVVAFWQNAIVYDFCTLVPHKLQGGTIFSGVHKLTKFY